MLCFILDTPHRGRYFHDCVTQSVENEMYQASPVSNHLIRTSVEPLRSSAAPEDQADPLNVQDELNDS
jgi:hypothetical protein